MSYTQMIALLENADAPVETAGREFFSSPTTANDRKKVLEFLLDGERYGQLFRLMYCGCLSGHIDMKNTGADYAAAVTGNSTIHTRYFSLFVQTAAECGIAEERFVPLLFAAATSGKKSVLYPWKVPCERYLARRACADYNRAWNYLQKNDPDFKLVSILLAADRERALGGLIDLAIYGKGVNKVALRRILRGYKAEVFTFVRAVYPTLKNDTKVAAVRLLLPFKNETEVETYLGELAATEKSKSVAALLGSRAGAGRKPSQKTDRKQIIKRFYDAMVLGTEVPASVFCSEWIVPPFAEVAESLFFGVYRAGWLHSIVVVDARRVLDIENRPYEFPQDSTVKVLHPTELTAKTEFLKRLNITQPFEQIKRKTYVASEEDKSRNGCFGVAGTVVDAADFVANMRKIGFRMLYCDADGTCDRVGLSRNGILCVLAISPTELRAARAGTAVQAQYVRFYQEDKVVRLGGKSFVDGVAPLSPAHIDARTFSEFMYSVYELTGCR